MSLGLCTSCCGGSGRYRTVSLNSVTLCFSPFISVWTGYPAWDKSHTITGYIGPQYSSLVQTASPAPGSTDSEWTYGSGAYQISATTNIPTSTWDDGGDVNYPLPTGAFNYWADLWTLDSNGNYIASGPTYTPTTLDGSAYTAPLDITDTEVIVNATLESEIPYGTIMSRGGGVISSSTGTGWLTALSWGTSTDYYYNDYMDNGFAAVGCEGPDYYGNVDGVDFSTYDDSIIHDTTGQFGALSAMGASYTTFSNFGIVGTSPSSNLSGCTAFGVVWVRSQALYTGPYVLITYLIMIEDPGTDGGHTDPATGFYLLLDPVSPCAGSGTGDGTTPIDIPCPDGSSMPSSAYGTWADGSGAEHTGYYPCPVGRLTKFIPGWTSCSAYLAANPHG